jgi:hypothetical protein
MTGRARNRAFLAARGIARQVGWELLRRDVSSPVPEVPGADGPAWTRSSALAGIDLDPARDLAFLRTELAPFVAEFSEARPSGLGNGFELWNDYYQAVDAEVLYAMVRYLRPRRILEIGSGHSTLVTAAACVMNAAEDRRADFTAVDPAPRTRVAVPGLTRLDARPAETLPLETFLELDDGDVIVVDSSHVVKLGGEVNRLVLDVLPRLRPGVVVHFHDVFWPFEYPRAWYLRGEYPNEQYLLQAFLSGNAGYRILFAAHAVSRAHRRELEELVPSLRERPAHGPAAVWLRRVG